MCNIVTIWINLEEIMLNEIIQSQKEILVIPLQLRHTERYLKD